VRLARPVTLRETAHETPSGGAAPEGLRNYGEATATGLENLKKLRRGSRFLFS